MDKGSSSVNRNFLNFLSTQPFSSNGSQHQTNINFNNLKYHQSQKTSNNNITYVNLNSSLGNHQNSLVGASISSSQATNSATTGANTAAYKQARTNSIQLNDSNATQPSTINYNQNQSTSNSINIPNLGGNGTTYSSNLGFQKTNNSNLNSKDAVSSGQQLKQQLILNSNKKSSKTMKKNIVISKKDKSFDRRTETNFYNNNIQGSNYPSQNSQHPPQQFQISLNQNSGNQNNHFGTGIANNNGPNLSSQNTQTTNNTVSSSMGNYNGGSIHNNGSGGNTGGSSTLTGSNPYQHGHNSSQHHHTSSSNNNNMLNSMKIGGGSHQYQNSPGGFNSSIGNFIGGSGSLAGSQALGMGSGNIFTNHELLNQQMQQHHNHQQQLNSSGSSGNHQIMNFSQKDNISSFNDHIIENEQNFNSLYQQNSVGGSASPTNYQFLHMHSNQQVVQNSQLGALLKNSFAPGNPGAFNNHSTTTTGVASNTGSQQIHSEILLGSNIPSNNNFNYQLNSQQQQQQTGGLIGVGSAGSKQFLNQNQNQNLNQIHNQNNQLNFNHTLKPTSGKQNGSLDQKNIMNVLNISKSSNSLFPNNQRSSFTNQAPVNSAGMNNNNKYQLWISCTPSSVVMKYLKDLKSVSDYKASFNNYVDFVPNLQHPYLFTEHDQKQQNQQPSKQTQAIDDIRLLKKCIDNNQSVSIQQWKEKMFAQLIKIQKQGAENNLNQTPQNFQGFLSLDDISKHLSP